jgi:guanine deaminase
MTQAKTGVSGHILVVEPNDITRKLIVGILNSRGFDTYEASDGGEAVGFLNKDLLMVVLDASGDSVETQGFIRKMHMEHRRLPLVAMTDSDDRDAVEKRLDLPKMSVLIKPVMPEKLLNNIENHLISGIEHKITTEVMTAPKHPPMPTSAPDINKAREEYMRRAIDLSQEKMHDNCGGPFGAVIVKSGKIIAEGWNEVTSSNDPTAHAEMQAIRKAAKAAGDYRLEGCEIYTSCEPCPMCLAAIYWARIDRIYYANTREDAERIGFDDDFIYRELAQPEHKRSLPAKMFLRDEAKIVFDEWLKKTDKTPY